MIKKRFYLLLLFICAIGLAQEPVSVHLTEKNGLPDVEFYDVLEDSSGFVWLAADTGLYRYDGKTYKRYTNANKIALSVFELHEDHKGRVWCTNIAGQFFYVENDTLHTFVNVGKTLNAQLSNFTVTDHYLVVFGFNKILKIDLKTKEITTVDNQSAYIGKPTYKAKQYMYSTGEALVFRDNAFNILNRIPIDLVHLEDKITSGLRGKSALFNAGRKNFLRSYFNGENKFHQFDVEKKSIKSIQVPKRLKTKVILNVFENDKELWFLTRSGVEVYQFLANQFIYKRTFLSGEFVTKVMIDKNQNYWFTTIGNGIFVIPNIGVLEYDVSALGAITCLEKINDHLVVFGTINGIVAIYDFESKTIKKQVVTKDKAIATLLYHPFLNRIFIGGDLDVYSMNLENYSVKKEFDFGAPKSFSLVDHQTLLYATYNNAGLIKSVSKVKKVEKFRSKRAYSTHYSKRSQTAYVGYVDRLISYNLKHDATEILNKNASIFALSITETLDGMLWVATFNDGLLGIRDNRVVVRYTTENGLVSNHIRKIKAAKNQLWISTDKGVQMIDVKSKIIKTLTKEEGIPSYKINGIEILKNSIVFSSNKGFFSIDKKTAFKPIQLPEVYFTNVEINKKDTIVQQSYDLPYDQNNIKISYNATGFKSEKYNTYYYRLLNGKNNNETWETTNSHVSTISYYNLKPGNYTFQLRPFLSDEKELSVIKSMVIVIHKPFWNQWWFYALSLMVISAVLYLFFNRKIHRLKEKQKLQLEKEVVNKQLILSQLENLRSQMNPHFIFNALNSIQEYIVFNEKELASTFLVKFSRLIRIYLEHSRSNEVTLVEEVKALKLYLELEKIRFEEVLDYTIEMDENLTKSNIKIPSLFIQPYVENALKHGLLHKKENRKLLVKYTLDTLSNTLICTIEDNGIGIVASQEINKGKLSHKPFATSANLKRVELLNVGRARKIEVKVANLNDKEAMVGTRVTIVIPLYK